MVDLMYRLPEAPKPGNVITADVVEDADLFAQQRKAKRRRLIAPERVPNKGIGMHKCRRSMHFVYKGLLGRFGCPAMRI